MASSTARPQLHTTCLIVYVWTLRSWPGGPPSTRLWRTWWWLQLLKSFPPRMSVPNFSERSWPSSKRLRFLRCLRVLQRRPTCSCYAVMPFSGTSISSPQFSLQCVQRHLKVTMWLVLNQRYFKRGSGPSDKLIVWQAHQWLSPDRKKSRPARRRHPRRRLLGLLCLTGWALLHPQRRERSHRSRPFPAGAGRARPRPFQGSKKSGKSSSASAAKKRWRVPGGGPPSRLCPALAESAGQLPGHRHRRGRGGHCIPATTSAHPSKHQFPDQEQPTRPSASRRCLADEGSHRTCHQREVPGFLQSVVSGTQEDRRSATCDRPVHSQPSHGGSTLQDGDARVRPISHQKSGVGGVDRHTRCLHLHVPMHQAVRKYLHFVVNKKVYQFTCLPFGLATSPREFTKLLRPVVSLLRQQGVKLHVYLDDWLIRADTPEEAQLHSQQPPRSSSFSDGSSTSRSPTSHQVKTSSSLGCSSTLDASQGRPCRKCE